MSGQRPSEVSEGKLVAVWGPTGAPGRSTTAINLAAELALSGKRVLLIDADTYGGSIAGYLELFDETPGFLAVCRLAAMDQLTDEELTRLLHEYGLEHGVSFTILTGIVNSLRWPEISAVRVRAALTELRQRFDVIVVDVGFNLEEDEEIASDVAAPRRNQATLEILHRADVVVGVATADVIGLARYIHSYSRLGELVTAEVRTVINRAVASEAASARHTLSRFAGITDSITIPEDVGVYRRCSVVAAPLCVVGPQSGARKVIAALAESLAPIVGGVGARPVAAPAGRRWFSPRERAAS